MNIINDALVDKLFKDPPKRTKEIPLLSEKTASGDGMVIINDAYSDFPITNLTLRGKSEQVTTTGVNLIPFPYTDKDMSKNGVTFEVQQDGGVNIYGTATESVDFFLSMLDYGNDSIFNNGKGNGKVLSGGKNGVEIEYHGTNKRLYLTIAKGKTVNTVIYPQLQNGSTSTPYEPYTGGKPSPSPEYPQEIKNVGKWNPETEKYEVDVNITGKNLINASVFEQGYLKSIDIGQKVSLNTETLKSFTSNMNVEAIQGASISISVRTKDKSGKKYVFTDENDTIISGKWDTGMNDYSIFSNIQVPQNACKLYFSVVYEVENNTELQIEVGSKVTDFEPYREPQTVKLTSDRPITKWDKLVEQDGQIGWLYGSRRYILTGNEVFESQNGYNIESYTNRFFILNDLLTENDALKPLAYMKCLRHKQYVYAPNIFEEGFETNKNQFHIKFLNERVGISTSDDNEVRTLKYSEYVKKMYKDGNPIEILYATKNKEFVPLPQDEQNAIRALKTYYPTTVITVDGGELPVGIEVTYMHPEYIPTKQSALRMWFKENPII